jgi:cytochrome c553
LAKTVVLVILVAYFVAQPASAGAEGIAFFEKKVRPLLVARCYRCHSDKAKGKKLRGGLALDKPEGWLRGGSRGPAVVPGMPDGSLLIRAIRYEDDDLQMPPRVRLPASEIATLVAWVKMGAPAPGRTALKGQVADFEAARSFWSFRPPQKSLVPAVGDKEWPRTAVDRFVLARLESEGLGPARDTDPRTLLRRAYFDLIGLPPTPEALESFVRATSRGGGEGDAVDDATHFQSAFQDVVDQLLASSHFGERWGRHWLDVARFAESSGGGRSLMFKNAWRYRDYVIDAFNVDKPYDQFITEQIAGDLLPTTNPRERDERLVATGYLVLGPTNYELQDRELLRMEVVDEQIDTMGRTFLGLTIGCARCHDHKFDPLPTKDYYALAGIFTSTKTLISGNVAGYVEQKLSIARDHRAALDRHAEVVGRVESELNQAVEEHEKLRKKRKPVKADTAATKDEVEARASRLEERVKELQQKIEALKEKAPPPAPKAMSVTEQESPQDGHVHIGGGVRNLGPRVPRGFLTVLSSEALASTPTMVPGESGRLQLARWLASPRNPLAARVMVNRIWHHLIGVGIVRTTDNFGVAGERPSHPKLLDYLALRFIEEGWSIKRLIRHIMVSRVYQLSSLPDHEPGDEQRDPENRLLRRAHRKRLDVECLRDAMLAVSGRMDFKAGGLTIRKISRYDLGYQFDTRRRSVYVPAFRNSLLEIFEVFDAANPNLVTGRRNVSTLATQALYLLNSPFVMEAARHAGEELLSASNSTAPKPDDAARIKEVYRRTLGRRPAAKELELSLEYIAELRSLEGELAAWAGLYHSLFASVDFLYLN